jgi:hypothetical protein
MADGDFRIAFGWRRHWKRKMLRRLLGPQAVLALEDLWADTAENRPGGVLTGMSDAAIEAACDWDGAPGALVAALAHPDLRLLDGEPGAYHLHDWDDHQPWIASAPERKAKAQHAAGVRWGNHKETPSKPIACSEHATSMPTAMPLSYPSPTDPIRTVGIEQNPSTPPLPGVCDTSIVLDPTARAFVNLPDGYVRALAAAFSGVDVPKALAEAAGYWSDQPRRKWRKDWNLTIRNRLRDLARPDSKATYASRKTAAEQAWVRIMAACHSEVDDAVESCADMLPDADPDAAFALKQFGATVHDALVAVKNTQTHYDQATCKRSFVDAYVAAPQEAP